MARILLLALLLTGCAAAPRYAEMQRRAPMTTFTTERTPEAYAACLAPKLLSYWATTTVVPDGDARVVAVPAWGTNGMLLTVTARADGQVEFREVDRIGAGSFDGAIEMTRSCL